MTVEEFNELVWDFGANGTDGDSGKLTDSQLEIVACAWRDSNTAEANNEDQDVAINSWFKDFLKA